MKKTTLLFIVVLVIGFYLILSSKLELKSSLNVSSKPSVYIPSLEVIKTSSFNSKTTSQFFLQNLNITEQDTIIHFWATWCGPCLDEIPKLVTYIDKYQKEHKRTKLVLVAINDKWEEIEKFFKKINLEIKNEWVILLIDNTNESYNKFRVDKVPESFLIRSGEVERLIGAQEWR